LNFFDFLLDLIKRNNTFHSIISVKIIGYPWNLLNSLQKISLLNKNNTRLLGLWLFTVAFQEGTIEKIAGQFGYSPQTLRNLINKTRKRELAIFPEVKPGPKGRQTSDEHLDLVIALRRQKKINSYQITNELKAKGISISARTVERILSDAGFPKLRRRTLEERGLSKKGILVPQRTAMLDFDLLKPFKAECKVAGIFFFLPYILESRIVDVIEQCGLPGSSDINNRQAALSMLCLKLIGNERLSHIRQYDTDLGFGVFAGLNVLPKPSYMGTIYFCNSSKKFSAVFRKFIQNFIRAGRSTLIFILYLTSVRSHPWKKFGVGQEASL